MSIMSISRNPNISSGLPLTKPDFSALGTEALLAENAALRASSEALSTLVESQAEMISVLEQKAQKGRALKAENERLSTLVESQDEMISALRLELDTLKASAAELKFALEELSERLQQANADRYSNKSEVLCAQMRLNLFNGAEADATDEKDDEVETIAVVAHTRKRRPKGGRAKIDVSGLERVVTDYTLKGKDAICPACGHAMVDMGFESKDIVHFVPARLYVEQRRRHKYVCPACSERNAQGDEAQTTMMRAPVPELPVPKGQAGPSLIAHAIHAKYELAQPFYRQERELASLGANISRQTLANWVLGASRRWLEPLAERIRLAIVSGDLIGADETPIQVLKEPERKATSKSYVWLLHSSAPKAVGLWFHYAPSRSTKTLRAILGNFAGYLQSDGYEPYFNLGPDVTNVACAAHVRRKFMDIVRAQGREKSRRAGSIALKASELMGAMFAVEEGLASLEPEKRYEARQKHLAPLMHAFREWLEKKQLQCVPGLALDKALSYAIKYWPYVENVLLDGRLELTNNFSERALKPFVIGRKNWLFSDTPKGADASCACYSLIETAKANGLSATRYIEWLLSEMPGSGTLSDSALDSFLPWSSRVPSSLAMTEAERRAKERTGHALSEPYLSERQMQRIVENALERLRKG